MSEHTRDSLMNSDAVKAVVVVVADNNVDLIVAADTIAVAHRSSIAVVAVIVHRLHSQVEYSVVVIEFRMSYCQATIHLCLSHQLDLSALTVIQPNRVVLLPIIKESNEL